MNPTQTKAYQNFASFHAARAAAQSTVASAFASMVAACPYTKAKAPYANTVSNYVLKAAASARRADWFANIATTAFEFATVQETETRAAAVTSVATKAAWFAREEAEKASQAAREVENAFGSVEAAERAARARELASERVKKGWWCQGEGDDGFGVDECAICAVELEERAKVGRMVCGHVFHWKCLMRWLEKNNTCPTCRHEM